MVKKVAGLCFIMLFTGSAFAWQQTADADSTATNEATHYISDDLFIFMHAGPGRQYRILGSVNAGTPVTKTDSAEANDFVEIIDDEGRTGWIEAQFLSSTTSRRILVTRLRDQVAETQASVAPMRQQLSQTQQALAESQRQVRTLTDSLAQSEQSLSQLQSTLDTQAHEEQMRYLMRGGALVAGGLLLGIIVTFIPKRRKRTDEWMN